MKRLSEYLSGVTTYKMDARKKKLLLWTAIITLCANGYSFLNYMPAHDAVNHMFSSAGEWEVQLGRFLQPYYASLRGNVVSPWLAGLIGAVFAVMSADLIADMIKIESPVFEILACGFLMANLSVTELCGIFIYIYDCCMIALFLSCLSVWCQLHVRHPWNLILGAVCIVLSMGLYQAYISVTIVLCAVVLLQKVLADTSWKEEVRSAVSMGLMMAIGAAGYLLLYKIMLTVWHTTSTSGSNGMGRLTELSVQMIFQNIIKAYSNIVSFFVVGSRHFGKIICTLHGVLLLIVMAGFILLLKQKKLKIHNSIGAVLICMTLPIWCNFTGVIQGENIVLRSSYALYLLFPIGIMIVDSLGDIPVRKPMRYLTGIICIFLLVRNIQYSNIAFMYDRAAYDRSISIMTRVLDDIETYEGYEIGVTPIAVIGEFTENDNIEVYRGDTRNINGHRRVATTYPKTTYNFWRSMGSLINGIEDDDILATYKELDEVQQMPCYPHEGYCRMIGDVMVVKIADRE